MAYINHHCTFVGRNWYCAVCRAENSFNDNGARYKAGVDVKELPEIRAPYFECNLEGTTEPLSRSWTTLITWLTEYSVNESESSELESFDAEELLVCVALVDVTGKHNYNGHLMTCALTLPRGRWQAVDERSDQRIDGSCRSLAWHLSLRPRVIQRPHWHLGLKTRDTCH